MKSPSGLMAVLKEFAKEVREPEILVADLHPSKKIKYIKEFCNKIGTTLHLL